MNACTSEHMWPHYGHTGLPVVVVTVVLAELYLPKDNVLLFLQREFSSVSGISMIYLIPKTGFVMTIERIYHVLICNKSIVKPL